MRGQISLYIIKQICKFAKKNQLKFTLINQIDLYILACEIFQDATVLTAGNPVTLDIYRFRINLSVEYTAVRNDGFSATHVIVIASN
jgi:hypothetical protein